MSYKRLQLLLHLRAHQATAASAVQVLKSMWCKAGEDNAHQRASSSTLLQRDKGPNGTYPPSAISLLRKASKGQKTAQNLKMDLNSAYCLGVLKSECEPKHWHLQCPARTWWFLSKKSI